MLLKVGSGQAGKMKATAEGLLDLPEMNLAGLSEFASMAPFEKVVNYSSACELGERCVSGWPFLCTGELADHAR